MLNSSKVHELFTNNNLSVINKYFSFYNTYPYNIFLNQNCVLQDKTLFTLGPLLNGVGGIYTKYLSKTRDKMVEKHITKYLKIQINI